MTHKHFIFLLHGIRDSASWQGNVRNQLLQYTQEEKIKDPNLDVQITPMGYGIFDALRFLLPISLIRNQPVAEVYEKLKAIRDQYPDATISVICHSFGTYIVGKIILMQFEVDFHKIILVGSVLSRKYPWYALSEDRVTAVLNEVGTRDIWPLMAKAFSWGYGIAGWLGFQQPVRVIDRYWHANHSKLLASPDHAYKHWGPYLISNASIASLPNYGGDGNEDRPYWTHLLSNGILKYLLLLAFGTLAMYLIPYTISREQIVIVPVNVGMQDDLPSLAEFEEGPKTGATRGLLKIKSGNLIRFLRAETDRWGNDRLQNIETFLLKVPVYVDASEIQASWNKAGILPLCRAAFPNLASLQT